MKKSEEIVDYFFDNLRGTINYAFQKNSIRVFNWIPKNAGTSIYKCLRPYGMIKCKYDWQIRYVLRTKLITFGHFDLKAVMEKNVKLQPVIKNSSVVTVLRDPVERFISIYSHYDRHGILDRYVKKPSMEKMLDYIEAGFIPKIGYFHHRDLSMFNPQSAWIDPALKNIFLDFHKLNSSVLCTSFDCNCTMVKKNVGDGRRKIDLPGSTIARIKSVYSNDYHLIKNIEFENDKNQ